MRAKTQKRATAFLAVIAAIAMAFVMLVGSVTPAHADVGDVSVTGSVKVAGDTDTTKKITITTAEGLQDTDTTTYTIYKVFNASNDGSGDSVSYTKADIDIPITSTDNLSKFDDDDAGNIHYYTRSVTSEAGVEPVTYSEWTIDTSTTNLSAGMISALGTAVNGKTAVGTVTITGAKQTKSITVPDYGYYYITTTTGSAVSITTTHPNATVTDKSNVPSVDKKVTGGDKSTAADSNTADVGDELTYSVDISAKKGAQNYVFHDTLSTGLTLGKKTDLSVKVGNIALTENTDYTVDTFTEDKTGDGSTENIKITFTKRYLDTITSDTAITVSYKATVNSSALKLDQVKNDAYLDYGTDNHTTHDNVITKLFGFGLNKEDASNSNTKLDGVQFTLTRGNAKDGDLMYYTATAQTGGSHWTSTVPTKGTDGKYTGDGVLTTADGGKLAVNGLEAGTYTLTEVKTNDGYNLLTQAITITITNEGKLTSTGAVTISNAADAKNSATDTAIITVQNTKGSVLPGTGGIGTTIFYTIGGIIVAGAVIALVMRRRRTQA